MERRILDKISSQNDVFMKQLQTEIQKVKQGESTIDQFSQLVESLKPVTISKSDFSKRKRAKNCVPNDSRCEARCAKGSGHEGEQCTRRKKDGCLYCGTHTKGIPHGIMKHQEPTFKEKTIWAEEYRGIMYYIDEDNVYNTEDIKKNKVNPEIIGSSKKVGNSYIIQLKNSV
jgi:hypothetical protein